MDYHEELTKIFEKHMPISSLNRNTEMYIEIMDLLTKAMNESYQEGADMAQGIYKRAYERITS